MTTSEPGSTDHGASDGGGVIFVEVLGAAAAMLGLLLLEAGIVPGASPTERAQIVAWALVLGASQQTFTTLIDRQAQVVLNSVATTEQEVFKRG